MLQVTPQAGDVLLAVDNRPVIQQKGIPFKDWEELDGQVAGGQAAQSADEDGLYFRDVLEYLRNGPRPMRMHFSRNTPTALAVVSCS